MDHSALATGGVQGAGRAVARTGYGHAEVTRLAPHAAVDGHAHDAPYLSIYLLGRYRERSEDQDVVIDGPAAAFHPAGAAHEDMIGEAGLRTLVVQFDPDWLKRRLGGALPDRSIYWTGGAAAAEASAFARQVLSGGASAVDAGAALVARWGAASSPEKPGWLGRLDRMLADESVADPAALAARLDLSLPWLLRAYRAFHGEGLGDRLRRRALERAVLLIQASDAGLAEIALDAGFCDQSHLARVCRATLGATPGQLRAERNVALS